MAREPVRIDPAREQWHPKAAAVVFERLGGEARGASVSGGVLAGGSDVRISSHFSWKYPGESPADGTNAAEFVGEFKHWKSLPLGRGNDVLELGLPHAKVLINYALKKGGYANHSLTIDKKGKVTSKTPIEKLKEIPGFKEFVDATTRGLQAHAP